MRGIKSIVLNENTYKENTLIEEVDLAYVPWKNNSMYFSFENCINLTTVTNINENISDMRYSFYNCSSLVNAPVIPNGVTMMYSTFENCFLLEEPPLIPSSVRYLGSTIPFSILLIVDGSSPNPLL
jgi:hypothetical protein